MALISHHPHFAQQCHRLELVMLMVLISLYLINLCYDYNTKANDFFKANSHSA